MLCGAFDYDDMPLFAWVVENIEKFTKKKMSESPILGNYKIERFEERSFLQKVERIRQRVRILKTLFSNSTFVARSTVHLSTLLY